MQRVARDRQRQLLVTRATRRLNLGRSRSKVKVGKKRIRSTERPPSYCFIYLRTLDIV